MNSDIRSKLDDIGRGLTLLGALEAYVIMLASVNDSYDYDCEGDTFMITLSKTDRALLAAKILCNGLIAVAAAAIAVFLASSAAGCFLLGHSGALW